MDARHSFEEKAAASAVASLSENEWKRTIYVSDDSEENAKPSKKARTSRSTHSNKDASNEKEERTASPALLPAPFFYYKDFSREPDDDPLAPLTPPGRVPNFPAKMHAILSRPDLGDVVAWMPHGRSWRVLKPREFETRVIPTYFEHSKFSSFIRQANGWGFRRITQGRDRNSYYHAMFLRGLPHLCKKMKRPGVSEKAASDPEYEPDFYKISELHPVPEKASDDESIMLHFTLKGGPKARMPVYSGPIHRSKAPYENDVKPPRSDSNVASIQRSLQGSEGTIGIHTPLTKPSVAVLPQTYNTTPSTPVMPLALPNIGSLTAAEQLGLTAIQRPPLQRVAALQASSQFAAGFAAATALTSSHIRTMLGQALVDSSSSLPVATVTPPGHNNSKLQ